MMVNLPIEPVDACLQQLPNRPEVLLVGPWRESEFASIVDWLQDARPQEAVTVAAAARWLGAQSRPPDVLLVAQPRPGELDAPVLATMQRLYPLLRIIVVAGSWCEGELRTGRPIAGTVRLYWYEFPAWWRASLAMLAQGKAPPWAEPLDDLRAGQLLSHSSTACGGQLVINTKDYGAFETLSAALTPLRGSCRWHPRGRPSLDFAEELSATGPIAGLWDGAQLDPAELSELAEFCDPMRRLGAPVLALLDFPRREHLAAAAAVCVAGVLGKPYQIALLADELLRLVQEQQSRPTCA